MPLSKTVKIILIISIILISVLIIVFAYYYTKPTNNTASTYNTVPSNTSNTSNNTAPLPVNQPAQTILHDSLLLNETLKSGESLTSSNGAVKLILQTDGNLVIYYNNNGIWSSGTNNGSRLTFQSDGNLVLYNSNNVSVWASNTSGKTATHIDIKDDGNLVMYNNSNPIWSTGSSTQPVQSQPSVAYTPPQSMNVYLPNNNKDAVSLNTDTLQPGQQLTTKQYIRAVDGSHTFILQDDGNAVVYDINGGVKWASGTSGAVRFKYQSDGNLVAYKNFGSDTGENALWASNSSGRPSTRLTIQTDGNLVLYNNDSPVWFTI